MTETRFANSGDGVWHIASKGNGAVYIRLGQFLPFIMAESEFRAFIEGAKEVLGEQPGHSA